jgi:short-subunit dehydrogenase
MPQQSAYNATKYAVRGFTEAIREEMLVGKLPVGVTCIHPGGIKTGIARNGRKVASLDSDALDTTFDKIAKTTPEKAAQIILDGALAKKPRVLVGLDAHALHNFAKFAGARYQNVFAASAKRIMGGAAK